MTDCTYIPYTAKEVAIYLRIFDTFDIKGETIAKDMLKGVVRFTRDELEILADCKGVTMEFLTEHDPAFRRYADPVDEVRKVIAARLLQTGMDTESAAEICGLDVERVRRLK